VIYHVGLCTYDHTVLSNLNKRSNDRSLHDTAFANGDMVTNLHRIVAERPGLPRLRYKKGYLVAFSMDRGWLSHE
jgi:hypothetical protein